MGLESATFISQLNAANPVGSVDNYSTADDHLRLVKSVLQNQFTALGTAAVTRTAAQLNFVDATSSIQTQLDSKEALANKNAANGYAGIDASGQLADARLKASNVTQFQASLAIAMTQLTGTVLPVKSVSNLDSQMAAYVDFQLANGTDRGYVGFGETSSRLTLANAITGGEIRIVTASGPVTINGGTAWHSVNDGSGSGLDADLLDGQQGTFYQNAGNLNAGTLLDARLALSNVSQFQASLSIACSQLTSTLADARLVLSNVSQFQASLTTRNISSKSGVSKTLQSGGTASGGSDGDIIYIY